MLLQVTNPESRREEADDGPGLVESNHGALSLFKAHKEASFCVGAGNQSRQELRENHTNKTVSSPLIAPGQMLIGKHTHTHGHFKKAFPIKSALT